MGAACLLFYAYAALLRKLILCHVFRCSESFVVGSSLVRAVEILNFGRRHVFWALMDRAPVGSSEWKKSGTRLSINVA